MTVLLHRSHCSSSKPDGWSGAPGEAAYIRGLCPLIVNSCRTLGMAVVVVDGDLENHPEFHVDYDAFVAPHYDANVYTSGGSFWGRAAASVTAAQDDLLGAAIWARLRAIPGAPAAHFERLNVNVTDYYGFRLTSANTPGMLVELGVGAPAAPDYLWLRTYVQQIADAIALGILTFLGGKATDIPTSPMSVLGPSLSFVAGPLTAEWAALYRTLAPQAGIRAEVAFAQALKETNNFTFKKPDGTPADAKPEWLNPAGLGVTGAPDEGNRFPTKEDGVRAHLGHLLWYFGPVHPVAGFCDKDQRHFGPHKGYPNDLSSLDGHWAVPGVGYGASVADIAKRITTQEEDMTKEEVLAIVKGYIATEYGPALEEELRTLHGDTIADAVKAVSAKLATP